jgi:RAB protein geranylgeranyltransferase component A
MAMSIEFYPIRPHYGFRELSGPFASLSGLCGDKLNEALNELCVDIDSNDGKHVRIFCE